MLVIGGGKQGEEHITSILAHSDAVLAGICEGDQSRREYLFNKYPGVAIYEGLKDFSGDDFDGIVMALPHHVYPQIWESVIDCGVPLLKEKPLGRTPEEASSFLSECRNKNISLKTAIQRRNHPSYMKLREMLYLNNSMQPKYQIRSIYAGLHLGFAAPQTETPDTWRETKAFSGGGALLDSGYHMIDLVLSLAGQFKVISSHIARRENVCSSNMTDDHAVVFGRSLNGWVCIESRTFSDMKRELVCIETDSDYFEANREGVWKNGKQVFSCGRDWAAAMNTQLNEFLELLHSNKLYIPEIRDQYPAMRIIDQAYNMNAGGL
ncbi:hypothetical protein JCM12856_31530 [Spirochaeta dissipatitropha]